MSFTNEDVHELISRASDTMKLQAGHRNGSISLQCNADHSHCRVDKVHLFNVFINLIDNAIKYSTSSPELLIRTFNVAAMLNIEVSDKGIGMDKSTQQKIFDRFYRYESGNVHNVKGFGLGLSYVRTVILSMGGSVSVQSKPGEGSTFRIILPLASESS